MTITLSRAMGHASKPDESARLVQTMDQFGVLTNRKPAVIALIHSILFLGVAAISDWHRQSSGFCRATGGDSQKVRARPGLVRGTMKGRTLWSLRPSPRWAVEW